MTKSHEPSSKVWGQRGYRGYVGWHKLGSPKQSLLLRSLLKDSPKETRMTAFRDSGLGFALGHAQERKRGPGGSWGIIERSFIS